MIKNSVLHMCDTLYTCDICVVMIRERRHKRIRVEKKS